MKNAIFANLIIIIVIAAAAIAGWYYYNQSTTYLSTDNAHIQGDVVTITPTAVGKITSWNGNVGQTVTQNQVVGTEDVGSAGDIHTPIAGTVVQSSASTGEVVTPGQPLASVVDLTKLYVIANVDETSVNDVKVGQSVDVTVDAFPGTLTGTVQQIGMATQSTFSVLPTSNATGNYTKLTQWIPVKITLQDYNNNLIPGLNCSVRIHK